MKKKITSMLLSLIMIASTTNIMLAEENTDKKNEMEEYIKILIKDSASGIKYAPFAEYNDFLVEQLLSINYDEYEAKFTIDKMGWDAVWKNAQELFGIDAYTQEGYELLFSDIITKVAELEKNNAEKAQEKLDIVLQILKTGENIEKIFKIEDSNDIQIKAITALRNKVDDLYRIFSGADFKEGSVLGEATLINDVLKVYAVAIRDYSITSKYLDLLKDIVYNIAEQENVKSTADAMRNAMDKIYREYHNTFSAVVSEIGVQINDRIKKEVINQSKAVIKLGLADIGLDVVANKLFLGVDIALICKDLVMKNIGIHQEVEAISKFTLSLGLTYAMQQKFVDDGRKALSDNEFTDDEYEDASLLFDLCKAIQSLNYTYADNLDVPEFWYSVKEAVGFSNDTYRFIAENLDDDIIIERYKNYSKHDGIKNIIDAGQCGETMYWEMTEDGELIILGEGDMYNSEYSEGLTLKATFPIEQKQWDNSKVTQISFDGNIIGIGNSAFSNAINLQSVILPNSIQTIGSFAFSDCVNLEKVDFSENLKSISYSAFAGCSKLNADNIPDSVQNIAQNAFGGYMNETFKFPANTIVLTSGMITDPNLKELTIPETVTKIEANFFYGLKSLEKVYMLTKHTLNAEIGINEMTAGYKFTVYGYENAKTWVQEMNHPFSNNNMGLGAFMPQSNFINYVPLTEEIINTEQKTIEENQTPVISDKEEILKSEYLQAQEYLKALQIGTEEAMEEYVYKYGKGDVGPNAKRFYTTNEYALDIYSDEAFTLNYKAAYLDENDDMNEYKDKNHYVMILPENAEDLDEGYHYLVSGDSSDFKFDMLPTGKYKAYVRSDLSEASITNDVAIFNITVHDIKNDIIDADLQTAIDFLKENGVMEGYEDGSFRPNKSMTRAEYAKIICKFTENDSEYAGQNLLFDDVSEEFWGFDYIMNVANAGLFVGYGNNIFGVNDTLTEEQAVTVLCRMLGDTYEDVKFIETRVNEKGGYSDGYISIAGEKGIDIENLQKTVPATRARVAKWLYQLYQIKNDF